MKKIINFAICLTVGMAYHHSNAEFKNKDEAMQAITSTHNLLFGKDNLLTAHPTSTDMHSWRTLLTNLNTYIKKIAGPQPSKNMQEVQKLLRDTANSSLRLLNTLNVLYVRTIRPHIIRDVLPKLEEDEGTSPNPRKINLTKIDTTNIKKIIEQKQLHSQKQELVQIQNSLKKLKTTYQDIRLNFFNWFKASRRSAKVEVIETIERLAFTLELTINKVFSDLTRLEKAVSDAFIILATARKENLK